MYGDDQKEAFIEEYLRSKVVASTSLYAIFRKTERFEQNLDKDVSEFNKEEILNMLKSFRSKSVNSLLNYVVILKHYSRWTTGVVGQNDYELIGKKDVESLVDKNANVLLTREDLDEIEENLLNWTDRAIVELLWEGIAGPNMKELFYFSKENVDFESGIITTVSGKRHLTERLKDLLPKAFAETDVMPYGKTLRVFHVTGKGRIYKERANSRGVVSDDACFRYIYRKIQIFRDYLEIPGLTMKNLQASGLWHYLQIAQKETKLDIREFLKTKEGKKLAEKYGFGDYWVDNIASKYSQYL